MDTPPPADLPPVPQEQSPAKKSKRSKPAKKWVPPPAKKKHSWLGLFFDFLLILTALLLGAGWFLTSDAGVRKFVFPQLSKKLGIEIQAKEFRWKILSGIYVEGFRLGPRNNPILFVDKLGAKYDGKALLHGELRIQEAFLDSPRFHWTDPSVESPLKRETEEMTPPPPPVMVLLPPDQSPVGLKIGPFKRIAISMLEIKNLKASFQSGGRVMQVQNLKLSARNLEPGKAGSLDLKGDFIFQETHASPITGTLQSQLDFHLDDHFLPLTANGQFSCDGLKGTLANEPLEGLAVIASLDLSSVPQGGSFLKKGEIIIQKGAIPLTTLSATGPLNLSQKEADLDLQFGPVAANVLDVFFANQGIKFQDTSLDCAGHYSLKEAGKKLSFNGKFNANPLNLTLPELPDGTWKPLVLTADVALDADLGRKTALVSKFDLEATQGGQPFLAGNLDSPMPLSWGKKTSLQASLTQGSSFTLQVSPFDLTPWLSILGLRNDVALRSAILASHLKIATTDQGHNLSMEGEMNLSRMAGSVEKALFADGSVSAKGKANIKDLKSFQWALSEVQASEKGEPVLNGVFDGVWDFSNKTGSALFQGSGPLKRLLALGPPSNLAVEAGSLGIGLKAKWEKEGGVSCNTTFSAKDVDLAYPPLRYQQFNFILEGGARWTAPNFQCHDLHAKADFAGKPACDWSSQLSYNTETGSLSLKLLMDPASTVKNVLQANGTFKNPGNQTVANLKISGQSLDLSSFYDEFFAHRIVPMPSSSSAKPSPAPAPSVSAPAPAETAASPSSAPAISSGDIQIQTDIDSFKVHDLVITDLKIPFHYQGNSLEMNNACFKLCGAPIMASIQPQKGSPTSHVEIKVDGAQIGPVADAFLPDQKGEIGGTLSADFTGAETPQAGESIMSGAGWMKGLHGDFHMAVRDAHLQKLPAIQNMLKRIADLLQTPDIANSTMENLDASAAIADGKMNTDNFHATGSAVQASVRGDIFTDQRIALEAGLKIKKDAMSHSSLLAPLVQTISAENGDWIKLPAPITMGGTLRDPQLSVDKAKLVRNTLLNSGVNLLKDFLKSKQKDNPSDPNSSQPRQQQPQQDQANPVQDLFNGLFKKK